MQTIDFKLLIDLADKLGVIQAVKNKLLRQPEPRMSLNCVT